MHAARMTRCLAVTPRFCFAAGGDIVRGVGCDGGLAMQSGGDAARSPIVRRLCDLHDRLTVAGFALAAALVGAIAAAFCYEVVARYFFSAPTAWTYDVGCYLLAAVIFLSIPEMTRRGAHIHVNLIFDYLGAARGRTLRIAIGVARGRRLPGRDLDHRQRDLAAILGRSVDPVRAADPEMVGLDPHPLRDAQLGAPLPAPARPQPWRAAHDRRSRPMTWWVALSGGLALLLSLFLLGVPIFVAFVVLNVVGVFVLFGASGFGLFANSIYSTATLGALSAVPLFIVMGEILFRSGAMDVLFDSLDRLIGRIRGRQYVLCIVLSAILGALSGAAMAVAGLLGRSLFPTMRKRGYDTQFSAGTILAGASLDPIIPPSVLAVIIATLADVSAGKMLVAGILPGLLLTGMFLVYVRDPRPHHAVARPRHRGR